MIGQVVVDGIDLVEDQVVPYPPQAEALWPQVANAQSSFPAQASHAHIESNQYYVGL